MATFLAGAIGTGLCVRLLVHFVGSMWEIWTGVIRTDL